MRDNRRDWWRAAIGLTADKKRVLVTGATGFVAGELIKALLAASATVVVLSRKPEAAKRRFGSQVAAYSSAADLPDDLGLDVIVHLAGANVFQWPWTEARKRTLMQSRLGIADQLLAFIARAHHKPSVWIQASAVGFYPTQAQDIQTESSSPGQNFAAKLCQAIEAKSLQAERHGLRVVNLRFGLILGRQGGVLPAMLLATQWTGGAIIGKGTQYVAWVHIIDAIDVIGHAMNDIGLQGAVNVVAPDAPVFSSFAKSLAGALHRPVIWRVPSVFMKLALGQRAPLLLEGAEIKPQRLLDAGIRFQFADINAALLDLA